MSQFLAVCFVIALSWALSISVNIYGWGLTAASWKVIVWGLVGQFVLQMFMHALLNEAKKNV